MTRSNRRSTGGGRFGRVARARMALAVAGIGAIGAASVWGSGAWAQAVPADRAGGADRGELRRDADAVRDTGASGLVVQARDAAGRNLEARSGVADLEEG